MSTQRKHSELQYLENYRLVFTNLSEVTDIQTEMAEYGYDETAINEGKALYQKARDLYDQRQQESNEEKQAYDVFDEAFDQLKEKYKKDHKKAKVALLKHPELHEPFYLKKRMPQSYLKLMQEAKEFYQQIQTNAEAKPYLKRFKLTEEIATAQLTLIEEVAERRAKYEKEKGESQQATKNKNKAFQEISEWIREFYTVAEIALEDQPQLLESIGKFVKS